MKISLKAALETETKKPKNMEFEVALKTRKPKNKVELVLSILLLIGIIFLIYKKFFT